MFFIVFQYTIYTSSGSKQRAGKDKHQKLMKVKNLQEKPFKACIS